MKRCSRCKQELHESMFSKNRSSKDGLARQCRECRRYTRKKWYNSNKEKHSATVIRNNKRYKKKRLKYIMSLGLTCNRCPESDFAALDFHHIDPDTKEGNISHMLTSGGNSIDRLMKEIAKCEVLCANCHRKETARRRGWYQILEEDADVSPLSPKESKE